MVASRLAAPHHHPDLLRLVGQKDHRLARRIARARQRHFLPGAQPGLDRRGPVMHAGAFEFRQIGECPAGDSARPLASTTLLRPHLFAIAQLEQKARAVSPLPSRSCAASSGMAISAPNFCAWL